MLNNLISDLRSTTKPEEKIMILRRADDDFLLHDFFRWVLKATFEPFDVYHIKLKASDIPEPGTKSINTLALHKDIKGLIEFCKKSQSHKKNREKVIHILGDLNYGSQELLIGILHKKWKAGVSSKTINKFIPGFITIFEVQLANKYRETVQKKKYKAKDRYCSYKLDGVRGVCLRIDGEWRAYSRQGKEFLTVDHIKEDLEVLYEKYGKTWWDGEFYVEGLPFEYSQGLVTSFTTGTSHELDYHVFMVGDVDDFLLQKSSSFEIVTDEMVEGVNNVVKVKQHLIKEDQIEEELEKAFDLGYEGIMLRDPGDLYNYKRSDSLLKLKENDSDKSEEETTDCLVLDLDIEDITIVDDGKMVFETLLNRIYVEQGDGKICKVGSGFNLEFRRFYTERPEDLIGKVVEVKFQGYGRKGLMRFPRLKRVREDLEWNN